MNEFKICTPVDEIDEMIIEVTLRRLHDFDERLFDPLKKSIDAILSSGKETATTLLSPLICSLEDWDWGNHNREENFKKEVGRDINIAANLITQKALV